MPLITSRDELVVLRIVGPDQFVNDGFEGEHLLRVFAMLRRLSGRRGEVPWGRQTFLVLVKTFFGRFRRGRCFSGEQMSPPRTRLGRTSPRQSQTVAGENAISKVHDLRDNRQTGQHHKRTKSNR